MTANQINYLRGREEKRHNEAVERETNRVNTIQARLKQVDQDLQRDLNAINAKYKQLQYELDRDLFELQVRRTDRELQQRDRELQQKDRDIAIREQANAINWSNIQIARDKLDLETIRQKEQERANKVAEEQRQQYISFEQAKLPQTIQSQHLSNAFTREQIKTEQTKDDLNRSNTFRNYFNAGMDAINAIFKVTTPLLVAK